MLIIGYHVNFPVQLFYSMFPSITLIMDKTKGVLVGRFPRAQHLKGAYVLKKSFFLLINNINIIVYGQNIKCLNFKSRRTVKPINIFGRISTVNTGIIDQFAKQGIKESIFIKMH